MRQHIRKPRGDRKCGPKHRLSPHSGKLGSSGQPLRRHGSTRAQTAAAAALRRRDRAGREASMLQRNRASRQAAAVTTLARKRRAEHLRDRHAEQRRSDVRPIVHILGDAARLAGSPAAHQANRDRHPRPAPRCSARGGDRIEDVRRAIGQIKALHPGRILPSR